MFNPDAKILKSIGVDLPILRVYLAGRISGDCIAQCLEWRIQIINHYRDYDGTGGSYPIIFFDALNSKEADSVDTKGLKSRIPPNLIYDKDILSIEKSDAVVANMDDFFENGLHDKIDAVSCGDISEYEFSEYLLYKIKNRRENLGTIEEVGVARYLGKPIILIVPNHRKEIFENHPFQKRASVIVTSVEELLKQKWLEVLYKSIAGSTGNY